MKWGLAIFALFTLGYFLTPVIFSAMKKSDYQNLYQGMQAAKIAGGAYDESRKSNFVTYSDKLIYGDDR